jgi:hypothetical protein
LTSLGRESWSGSSNTFDQSRAKSFAVFGDDFSRVRETPLADFEQSDRPVASKVIDRLWAKTLVVRGQKVFGHDFGEHLCLVSNERI